MKVKFTLNDPYLGERDFPIEPIDIIKDQIQVLSLFRDDGRVPSQELLDDIAAYQFILLNEDAIARAKEYFQFKHAQEFPSEWPPRAVARALGWTFWPPS